MKNYSIVIILIISTVFLIYCEKESNNPTEPTNKVPTITSLQSMSDSTKIGGIVQITCMANDPDGDSLTYTWNTVGGSITGTGHSINWTAPLSAGIYVISCYVEDGNGGIDSAEIDITVILLPISTQGLIGYWPIIGNANDMSGYGNDGFVFGAILIDDRNGNPDNAFSFDGIDDIIEILDNSNLKPPLPITISCWLKMNRTGRNHILTTNYHPTNYYGIYMLTVNDSTLYIGFGDGGVINPASGRSKKTISSLSSKIWYHIVGVIRGSTDMDIYINGINQPGTYTGSGSNIAYDNGNFNLGRHDTKGNGPPIYLNGELDEIIMFSRVLSEQEVLRLYQNN